MDKVESADSIALGESHQSTEQLDKNEKKKKSTIKDKFIAFISPLLLSSHEPLPQNSTRIQEILETFKSDILWFFVWGFKQYAIQVLCFSAS